MLLDELQMIDLERKEVRLTRSLDESASAENSAKSFDAQWLRDAQGDVTRIQFGWGDVRHIQCAWGNVMSI